MMKNIVNKLILMFLLTIATSCLASEVDIKTLPEGWTVSYEQEYSSIDITRTNKILASSCMANVSGFEEPAMCQFSLLFRVVPKIPLVSYRRMKVENQNTLKQMDLLYEDLIERNVNHKFDSFLPQKEEDKKDVARYNYFKKSLHHLPDFHFEKLSLHWIIGDPKHPMIYIENNNYRLECDNTRKKVIAILSAYEPSE